MQSHYVEKTFLFTDLQQSSFLWEQYPTEMENALRVHDEILQSLIESHNGVLVKMMGDGAMAVFENVHEALRMSIEAQDTLENYEWGIIGSLKIRIGIHLGSAQLRDGDYFGPAIGRTARIMSAGHGGQILMSEAARKALNPSRLESISISDLGEFKLKGMTEPERIFQIYSPSLQQEFPPLNTQNNMFKNFPQIIETFYARESEIALGLERLRSDECRLLTIVGAGGSGKTRLTIEISESAFTEFSHGALFVPLAHQVDHEKIYREIGNALQFSFYGAQSPEEQILEYLENKDLLIILDNFEHLINGAALLSTLLDRCTRVKCLVSSRQILNVKSEWVIRIGGLSLEESPISESYLEQPALMLFMAKAKKTDPHFELTPDSTPHVIEICKLVDGIPLGIELAAAWISILSCEEIAKEIKRNLDFLEVNASDGINQYQSLRAVFESSWYLLGEEERDLLRRLSIFLGEFDRESSENICEASISQIRDLVDKSLVLREQTDFFRLQQLLKQFGMEKLHQDESAYREVVQRYCAYYASLLNRADEKIKRREPQAWETTQLEVKNILFAWNLALEIEDIDFLDTAAIQIFYIFYHQSNYHEGLEIFDATIEALDPKTTNQNIQCLVKLKLLRAYFSFRLGQTDESRLEILSALGALDERREPIIAGLAYQFLANIEERQSNFEKANEYIQRSIEIRKLSGDDFGLGNSLNSLGSLEINKGNLAAAKESLEESLTIRRDIQDYAGIPVALNNLGNIAYRLGDHVEARRLYAESTSANRELGNSWYLATSLSNLGLAETELENYEKAQQLHKESFDLHYEIGDQHGMARAWTNMALVSERTSQQDIAINMLKRSIAIREEIGDHWGLAYSLTQLGRNYLAMREFGSAQSSFSSALLHLRAIGPIAEALESILGIAQCEIAAHRAESAIKLLNFVIEHEKTSEKISAGAREQRDLAYSALASEHNEHDAGKNLATPTWDEILDLYIN